MFNKKPICEVCNKGEAVSFSFIEENPTTGEGYWKYCCNCTSEREKYYIRFENFFDSPASTIDWLAHMHEKTWMSWTDFMDMMNRFRKATNSFGAL